MFEKDLERFSSAEFRNELLSCLYEGDNLSEACAACRVNPAALGMAMNENLEFDAAIRRALAFRVDIMTDKLENIQDHEDDPIMAGVISKNIQWLASKRSRNVYGEKLDVTHNHIVSIKDAMNEAQQRTLKIVGPNALIQNMSETDMLSVQQQKQSVPAVIDIEDDDEIDPLS